MTQKTVVGREVEQETLHNGGSNIEEKDSIKWYILYPHSSSRCAKGLSTDISTRLVHNGFKRTYSSLKQMYHWKGMKKTIQRHCNTCSTCMCKAQHKSPANPKGTLQGATITNGIHCHGLDWRILPPPLKQRKQVCTHSCMYADRIYFLHPDKIQESRGCHESIDR